MNKIVLMILTSAVLANAQTLPVCILPGATAPFPASPAPGFILDVVSLATGYEIPLVPSGLARVNIIYSTYAPNRPNFVAAELPLPTQIYGTEVLIQGVPSPVIQAGYDDSRFPIPADFFIIQVPSGTAPLQRVDVQLRMTTADGKKCLGLPSPRSVFTAYPQVFTDKTGVGFYDSASQTPAGFAVPGQWLTVYVTGLGIVSPAPIDGMAASQIARTMEVVSVSVGGLPAEVGYAGSTPGFVGIGQINFRVPATGLKTGLNLVVINVGGGISIQLLYISVQ